MRRFSQRNSLVTLSDINITPLLDLAFVLLIIFIITTPLLTQSINLKLPTGGQPSQKVTEQDVHTIEITMQGRYRLDRREMSLDDILKILVRDSVNPNMVVDIRADENGRTKELYAVLDRCLKNGISRFSLKTEPPTPQRR